MPEKKKIDLSLYRDVKKSFYHDQTLSKNPVRKWFHVNRYKIANSLVKSKYGKDKKTCDLGAGSCDWNIDQLKVFGIDLNKDLLQEAKDKNRLYDYKVAEAHATGLPDGSFDIATSLEFLEHVEDYNGVVKEAKRILKEGGSYIVSVPFDVLFSLWRPLFFLQVIFQGYLLQKPYYKKRCGHINHFSVNTIRDVLIANGFTVDTTFVMRKLTIFLCATKGKILNPKESYDDVTIILPTLNEERNISNLLSYLITNYYGCHIIVTDDGSKDNTKENSLGLEYENLLFHDRTDSPIHGLTISALEASALVKTKYFVVMDADGQHPPSKVSDIVNLLRMENYLVVASRVEIEKQWSLDRRIVSWAGTFLGKMSLSLRGNHYLTFDVLGGFFGCNTRFWKKTLPYATKLEHFRLRGYKILFDFLKYAPSKLKIEEVYYKFETRKAEVSKLNFSIFLEYIKSCFLP